MDNERMEQVASDMGDGWEPTVDGAQLEHGCWTYSVAKLGGARRSRQCWYASVETRDDPTGDPVFYAEGGWQGTPRGAYNDLREKLRAVVAALPADRHDPTQS